MNTRLITIIRPVAFLLFLTAVIIPAFAQDKPPVPLFEAAHCLATEKQGWLDLTNTKEISMGYKSDVKTTLGDKYIYVVVYTNPHRTAGRVFDIRIKQDHRRIYSIENDATFVSTPKGVDFPEPPVGGTWAQNQLVPAIQQMEHRHKWYVASVKALLKPNNHVQCEFNADLN